MKIGDNIRKKRKEFGLTQKELATLTGIAEISIRSYENGKRQPRLKQLTMIAEALNTDITDLMNHDEKTSEKGLIIKYNIFKVDDGSLVNNCFVLRLDKDFAAIAAVRAYIEATPDLKLVNAIYNRVGGQEKTDFADILRELRKSYNLTQKELAELTGLSERGIQNYEAAKNKPTSDILIQLADYFDVSVDYLLGREPKQSTNE